MDPKKLEFHRKSPPESKKKKSEALGTARRGRFTTCEDWHCNRRGTETVVVRFTPCWDHLVMHKSCLLFKSYPHVRTPEDGLRESKRNMKIPSHLLMSQAILGHYSNCCLHCCDQYPLLLWPISDKKQLKEGWAYSGLQFERCNPSSKAWWPSMRPLTALCP